MSSMLSAMTDREEDKDHDNDKVYANSAMYEMMNRLNNPNKSVNDMKSFRAFIESGTSGMDEFLFGHTLRLRRETSAFTQRTRTAR